MPYGMESANKENVSLDKHSSGRRAKSLQLIKNKVIVTRRQWKKLKNAERSVVDTPQKEFLLKENPWKKSLASPGAESTTTQLSQCTVSTIKSEIKRQVEGDTWVQCESSDCLKWRRVPRSEVASWDQGSPWYCFLNSDPQYSTCDDPQEDFSTFERTVKKCKMRYVMSALPAGSLVWATLPGYCRWPAIVCPDPASREAIIEDYDGEPWSYHVEFLGKKHSHSWVTSKYVERYGAPERGRHSPQTSPLAKEKSNRTQKRKRSSCHGNNLDSAVEEADSLLDTLAHDRLDNCHFKAVTKDLGEEDDDDDVEEDEEEEQPEQDLNKEVVACRPKKRGRPRLYPEGYTERMRRIRQQAKQEKQTMQLNEEEIQSKPQSSSYSETPVRGRPRKNVVVSPKTENHLQNGYVIPSFEDRVNRANLPKYLAGDNVDPSEVLEKEVRGKKRKVEEVLNTSGVRKKRRVMDVNYDDEDDNSRETDEESIPRSNSRRSMPRTPDVDNKFLERMEAGMLVGSPAWLRNHGHRVLDGHMTLREKFIEDTQLYAENKKKFERDLRRFMASQGKTIQKPPVWHGIQLNLFQLYMAIHDLGGSEVVSQNKKWLSMYKEIFGPASSKVQTAHGLKSYYTKNILPYELYLKGEDHEAALEYSKSMKGRKYNHAESDDEEDSEDEEDWAGSDKASSVSASTQELLSELRVQASQASAYDILKEKVEEESSKMDLNVMFYDDVNLAQNLSDPSFINTQAGVEEGEMIYMDALEAETGSIAPSSIKDNEVMYDVQSMGEELHFMNGAGELSELEAFAAQLHESKEVEQQEAHQESEAEYSEQYEENVVPVSVEEALQYQSLNENQDKGLDFDEL